MRPPMVLCKFSSKEAGRACLSVVAASAAAGSERQCSSERQRVVARTLQKQGREGAQDGGSARCPLSSAPRCLLHLAPV